MRRSSLGQDGNQAFQGTGSSVDSLALVDLEPAELDQPTLTVAVGDLDGRLLTGDGRFTGFGAILIAQPDGLDCPFVDRAVIEPHPVLAVKATPADAALSGQPDQCTTQIKLELDEPGFTPT